MSEADPTHRGASVRFAAVGGVLLAGCAVLSVAEQPPLVWAPMVPLFASLVCAVFGFPFPVILGALGLGGAYVFTEMCVVRIADRTLRFAVGAVLALLNAAIVAQYWPQGGMPRFHEWELAMRLLSITLPVGLFIAARSLRAASHSKQALVRWLWWAWLVLLVGPFSG